MIEICWAVGPSCRALPNGPQLCWKCELLWLKGHMAHNAGHVLGVCVYSYLTLTCLQLEQCDNIWQTPHGQFTHNSLFTNCTSLGQIDCKLCGCVCVKITCMFMPDYTCRFHRCTCSFQISNFKYYVLVPRCISEIYLIWNFFFPLVPLAESFECAFP